LLFVKDVVYWYSTQKRKKPYIRWRGVAHPFAIMTETPINQKPLR